MAGTEFPLYADLSHGRNGLGHFMLSASSLRRSAPASAVFYGGAVATELASAPQAWRTLVTAHFPVVARPNVSACSGTAPAIRAGHPQHVH